MYFLYKNIIPFSIFLQSFSFLNECIIRKNASYLVNCQIEKRRKIKYGVSKKAKKNI